MKRYYRLSVAFALLLGVALSPMRALAQTIPPPNVGAEAPVVAPAAPAATDCATQTDIPQAECETLVALYTRTDGPNWKDSPWNNWNVTQSPCSWTGVYCSGGTPGQVVSIYRRDIGLSGPIPNLSALTSLQHLDMSSNQLSGPIPDLSALTGLQTLILLNNQLEGEIPDLSALTSLEFLDLSENELSGPIPDLSALTSLQHLWLSFNQLEGEIPDLSALTSLQDLWLGNNQLSGSIPDFSALTSLQTLLLYNNQLSGSIPNLSALTSLRYLYLYNNQLEGEIPALPASLYNLYLYNNQLSGSIPNLSALTSLRYLYLYNNQLEGEIPTLPASLHELFVNNNQLNGSIPASVCVKWILDLGYNKLAGEDDPCVTARDPDWADTQTVPPTNVQMKAKSATRLELTWTPIIYTGNGGYYEVLCKTTENPTYTSFGKTANKLAAGLTLEGLTPDTDYDCHVTTFTPAHDLQQNDLTSEASSEVSARTHPATPLIAAFTSLYGSDRITYTVLVTNTGNTPQDALITGHLPADSELVSSNGSALQPGGAYGAGFVTLDVPALAGGTSTELVWSVKMRAIMGDIIASATVRNESTAAEFDSINQIYRILLMFIFNDSSLVPPPAASPTP